MPTTVTPAIDLRAFNCPHCSVLTSQHWFNVVVSGTTDDKPPVYLAGELEDHKVLWEDMRDADGMKAFVAKMISGLPFVDYKEQTSYGRALHNASVSRCYNCHQFSIWVYDKVVWPVVVTAIEPNPDLPEHVARDFVEAAKIVALSPRGAAALLRLAIQKLCEHLGEAGHNINADIKALVEKGLDRRIQQALDIVRVVGNNAVHPGQIDLRDDRSTANQLFNLVNLIAEKMISEPKHVDAMFSSLPEQARAAIEKRDGS